VRRRLVAVGALLAGLIVALMVLRVVGLEPHERRAGLWLTGDLVTAPVTDWSFADKYPTIFVQTQTWYGVPHSVTATAVAANGQLYLTSTYPPGVRFPEGRVWNRNIARDPHVRLKIGSRVFDRTLVVVTDPAERAVALEAKARKYPALKTSDPSRVQLFRVAPG